MLVIGGGAAVGKTTVAAALAANHGASVLPIDAIWLALRAVTSQASHPDLHDIDLSVGEIMPERGCEHDVKSAQAISKAMDPVIEYYLSEGRPVVMEGAWIAPSIAARWTRDCEGVQAVFIHEPEMDEVMASMIERSGTQGPRPRIELIAEACWLVGNWARESALAESLPVVYARPRERLADRVLAAIRFG